MKLLHSEVDVVPGRKPQKQPLPEGHVGVGMATLRIDNTTERQNQYTVRIKCDQPYWQDAWFTIAALPPTGGPENAPPSGKPDQAGPRNQSLTIFIKDRGVRDVVLSFVVPDKSECRAGVYKATVVVETRVVSDDPHVARKERITELPLTVIIRPFYKWTVAYAPEEKRVGILRRRADFELTIDNQGNDWLYLDLKAPRPQNLLVEAITQRVAIPPPEPGRESTRTIPLKGISRMKVIRGPKTPTALSPTLQRVDAPSIPPLPEAAAFGPSSANLGAAVVGADTTEVGPTTTACKAIYCPPIPDTFTGFLEALVRNVKGLVVMAIGAILAMQVFVFMYEMYVKNITEVRVSRSQVKLGEPFRIRGKNLVGAQILLYDPETKAQLGDPIIPKSTASGTAEGYVEAVISDQTLNNRKVIVGAQRLGRLTLLNRFLPVVKDPAPVLVGQLVVKSGPPSGSVTATIAPGQDLTIGGQNFGDAKGKVLLDGNPATIVSWSASTIKAKSPSGKQDGDTFSVAAFTSDGTPIPISPATVSIKTGGGGEIQPVDGEIQLDKNGNPIAKTGQKSHSGSQTTQTAASGDLPDTYNLLLTDSRSDYDAAIRQARGSSNPGAIAVSAFAYAALGRTDEARSQVMKANQLIGSRKTGKDIALLMLTAAKVGEQRNPAGAKAVYGAVDSRVEAAAPGFVFKDIVLSRYKMSANSTFEAKVILKQALEKQPTPQERQSIQQLLQQVGG